MHVFFVRGPTKNTQPVKTAEQSREACIAARIPAGGVCVQCKLRTHLRARRAGRLAAARPAVQRLCCGYTVQCRRDSRNPSDARGPQRQPPSVGCFSLCRAGRGASCVITYCVLFVRWICTERCVGVLPVDGSGLFVSQVVGFGSLAG